MDLTKGSVALFAGVVLASTALTSVAPSASALKLVTRYAAPAPTGSGTACTQDAPCAIDTAVNDASAGQEIVIEPGSYGTASAPLTTSLMDNAVDDHLNIHGESGEPAPVIFTNSAYVFSLYYGSSLSHVTAVSTSGTSPILAINDSTVDHVIAIALGAHETACSLGAATLTDSVCDARGTDGVGASLSDSDPSTTTMTATLRGDTVEAPGPGGVGLLDSAGGNLTLDVNATNTIVRGTTRDINAVATSASAAAAVTLKHCNYSNVTTSGSVGPASITPNTSPTLTAKPVFVSAAHNDFHERHNSPTIDHGVADPAHDTDVEGNPRTLGSAPDIGAYEFLPKPTLGALKHPRATRHALSLTVKVNPEGLATTAHLVATHAPKQVSKHVSIGSARTASSVHLIVHGLKPHTTYHLHVVATSAGGRSRSAVTKLTTG